MAGAVVHRVDEVEDDHELAHVVEGDALEHEAPQRHGARKVLRGQGLRSPIGPTPQLRRGVDHSHPMRLVRGPGGCPSARPRRHATRLREVEDVEEREDDPVGEPVAVVLRPLGGDRLHRLVDRVQRPEDVAEEPAGSARASPWPRELKGLSPGTFTSHHATRPPIPRPGGPPATIGQPC